MIKTITFLKRRPDMSREEFEHAYEEGHVKLGEVTLAGRAERYIRRYLIPLDHPLNEDGKNGPAAEFDAVMEMWFKDRADYEATMALIGSAQMAEEIVISGHEIFDRNYQFTYEIYERESILSHTLAS